ncbi:polymorphic toxin-type HINT domain-containing protein [Methylosoma difficile]
MKTLRTVDMQNEGCQARFSDQIKVIEESCFYGETRVHVRINAHDTHLFEYAVAKEEISRLGLIGKTIKAEIWNLQPGIEVLSRCETTGEVAYRKITRVFEYESQEVYELTYSREDEAFGPGHLVVTGNHPFWVVNKGWVRVEDLEVGDPFLTSDGTHSHLITLKKERFKVPVYNIEVEGFHTYFVGGLTGLWVHNTHCSQTETLEAVNWTGNMKTQCFLGTTPICMELGDSPIDKPYTTITAEKCVSKDLTR